MRTACAAPTVSLNTPLRRILDDFSTYVLPGELEKTCAQYTIDDPIATFVSPAFYQKCIPARVATERDSPFFLQVAPLEWHLREKLAKHWLTLDLTAEDLGRRAADPTSLEFKPLAEINFTNFVGHRAQTKWLRKHGIFLVRDFERLHAAEMRLPEIERWRELHRERPERIIPFVRGIEAERAKIKAAHLSPADRAAFTLWLESTVTSSHDPAVRAACEVVLAQLNAARLP
jgi:hypothetical protein